MSMLRCSESTKMKGLKIKGSKHPTTRLNYFLRLKFRPKPILSPTMLKHDIFLDIYSIFVSMES
jgi:hypothetical protein